MVKTMLIPVDGSAQGGVALDYGLYMAPKFETVIAGLHVIDIYLIQGPVLTDVSGAVGMPPYDGFFEAVETTLHEKADLILKDFEARCKQARTPCSVKKGIGKIPDVIVEEAAGADWIVMAKKGEHFHLKEGGLLGSVAEAVIRKSGKPVMVTPEHFVEIESMALAYDGSEPAKKALDLSLRVSERANWPLTALIITDSQDRAAELTGQIEDAAQPLTVDCEVVIAAGKEVDEMLGFISEGAVELMVMGAYGHNRLRHLLLGSTTSQIVAKSPIPVLLTR